MKNLSQENAPIYEALERFRRMRIVPFDVMFRDISTEEEIKNWWNYWENAVSVLMSIP